MTADHAILLREISANFNSALASFGFGTVMATAVILALVRGGLRPSRFSIALLMVGAVIFCASWAQWAQGIHFAMNVEIARILALVAACAIVVWLALTMVERMPPGALLGALALLLVCVLFGALAIWSPTKNLFLLAVVVIALSVVAACAILGWALIRMAERRPIIVEHAQFPPQLEARPREIDRGPLLDAPRNARALQPYRQRNQSCSKL